MIAVFRPQPYAGPVIQPQPSPFWLLHWHFQPLTSPQALNALVIDQPTGVTQQSRDSAVSIAAILPRQCDHISHQTLFIRPAPWVTPLGRSMLAQHPANSALGHRKRAADMIDADTTSCGA
jgi:hypothetical protein